MTGSQQANWGRGNHVAMGIETPEGCLHCFHHVWNTAIFENCGAWFFFFFASSEAPIGICFVEMSTTMANIFPMHCTFESVAWVRLDYVLLMY